jgi:hypothetical protein
VARPKDQVPNVGFIPRSDGTATVEEDKKGEEGGDKNKSKLAEQPQVQEPGSPGPGSGGGDSSGGGGGGSPSGGGGGGGGQYQSTNQGTKQPEPAKPVQLSSFTPPGAIPEATISGEIAQRLGPQPVETNPYGDEYLKQTLGNIAEAEGRQTQVLAARFTGILNRLNKTNSLDTQSFTPPETFVARAGKAMARSRAEKQRLQTIKPNLRYPDKVDSTLVARNRRKPGPVNSIARRLPAEPQTLRAFKSKKTRR